ncbi:hypothetical protein B0J13DRAFT_295194 [Dactylonectria estremocensis]|uniref:Zn(2)-C6 fungal-type domain-containing protein n=1 Tax=Dactylonectria estremocensis TaxID=1079267 RepID=A0A9P9J5J5_9HYPO|nr:hypothetical protein B0J13DRAFT_295194 [Dactylonectria estremocensis]
MSGASNQSQLPTSAYVLKTCQTCFHAKIRCDKSQDSETCDRCLRLGKECVFKPARRRPKASRQRLEVRTRPDRVSKSPSSPSVRTSTSKGTIDIINKDASLDPFERGVISTEAATKLIDWFRTRMISHFPFVMLPDDLPVNELNQKRPCLCLAALAAAAHSEPQIQQALGRLFNQVIAVRMVHGNINDLDLLQGLLIHLAWAHFQPRPKRYTQHLHLATSIVCDLRLDRPRKPNLWSVDGGKDKNEPDWGPDEKRALAGVYYLSSSSSLVLQKSRHFSFTPYILSCCEDLALQNQNANDKYLGYIIQLQSLTEGVEDMVGRTSTTGDGEQFKAEIQKTAQKLAEIKSTWPFSLSKSPTLLLQYHLLELLLSQASPKGTPFGLDKFHDAPNQLEQQAPILNWLSSSISAVRSLISVALVPPQGEESAMSNTGWIIIYCGLSLAVRFDLIAAKGVISDFTQHLRQLLDIPHTLRQIVLRLEAVDVSEPDITICDHRPFHDLAKRVRRLEEWYFVQTEQEAAAKAMKQMTDQSPDVMGTTVPDDDPMSCQNTWTGNSAWYQSPDLNISTFLFTDPVDFSGMFAS